MSNHYGRGRASYYITVLVIILVVMRSTSVLSFLNQGVRRQGLRLQQRQAILVDTDVGFDDLCAIRGLTLSQTQQKKAPKKLIFSTVDGISSKHYGGKILETLYPKIPVQMGIQSTAGNSDDLPSWLIELRQKFHQFVEDTLHIIPPHSPANDDSREMIEGLTQQKKDDEDGWDVICIGPLTNIAEWVSVSSQDEIGLENIENIWIMGGNMPIHSANDENVEYNFQQDPKAVTTVLSKPLKMQQKQPNIYLITSDVSSVQIPKEITDELAQLAKSKKGFYNQLFAFAINDVIHFDPICMFAHLHPSSVTWKKQKVLVQRNTGLLLLPTDNDQFNTNSCDISQEIYFATDFDQDHYFEWVKSNMITEDNYSTGN